MRGVPIAAALASALALAASAGAGGWATVGVSPAPEGIEAGETWSAEVRVLQHGRTPLAGVAPTLTIRNEASGKTATFAAKPTGKAGVYRAAVKFPSGGKWSYVVNDDFGGGQRHTFAPVTVGGASAGDGAPIPVIVLVASVLAAALLGLAWRVRVRRPDAPAGVTP